MSFDTRSTLMQLLSLDAIPGHETVVADVIEPLLAQGAISTHRDILGNVIAQFGSQDPDALRVMVFAHMDEVGFMVRKIEQNGFIRFERVGGPAQITMSGSTVNLQGSKGSVPGCIGIKSYHFSKGDERTHQPAIDQLWIDIGASSKQDALAMGVNVGTPITLNNPPRKLGNNLVCSKALDNRLGCTALLGLADKVAGKSLDVALFIVAAVQEEFNIRGILPAVNAIRPELTIGIDITPSCDTPDLADYADLVINQGPGITCLNYHGRGTLAGLITSPKVVHWLEKTAEQHHIPVQREVAPGVITESGYIQLQQDGILCAGLSIPCRYTHSPSEVASLSDLQHCIDLLAHLIEAKAETFPLTTKERRSPQ
ncbi:M42 family metallopeptidase [Buttiauxella noackiae]|uniref:M42 family metallopeptidase n=1 Tax=Buttiauxella noackiae TaxID=82992 RepID=UPI0028D6719C|nr:M42 family metallopeptidase [Buttiauxella noackiae]